MGAQLTFCAPGTHAEIAADATIPPVQGLATANCGAAATRAAASAGASGGRGTSGRDRRASQEGSSGWARSVGRAAAAVVLAFSPMAAPIPTAHPPSSIATRVAVDALYVNSVAWSLARRRIALNA